MNHPVFQKAVMYNTHTDLFINFMETNRSFHSHTTNKLTSPMCATTVTYAQLVKLLASLDRVIKTSGQTKTSLVVTTIMRHNRLHYCWFV